MMKLLGRKCGLLEEAPLGSEHGHSLCQEVIRLASLKSLSDLPANSLKSAAFSRLWMITTMKLQFAKMYLCTGLLVFSHGGCACSPHACPCYLKQLNVPPLTCSDFSLQKPTVGNLIPSLVLKGVQACLFSPP